MAIKVIYHRDNKLEEFMSSSTLEELKAYIRITDGLLNERNRVLEAIPMCNVHGPQCIPHALRWIEQQKGKKPMKWKTAWWGVTLIAETPEDEALLEQLHEALPQRPEREYENGKREICRNMNDELILSFER